MPEWLAQELSRYKRYLGIGIVNSQLLLLAIALAISAIQWLLVGHASFASTLIYTFFAGNAVTILLALCEPLYHQPFPRDWIVFIALLFPISILQAQSAAFSTASSLAVHSPPLGTGRAGTSHTLL